jgi:hypothetical protein
MSRHVPPGGTVPPPPQFKTADFDNQSTKKRKFGFCGEAGGERGPMFVTQLVQLRLPTSQSVSVPIRKCCKRAVSDAGGFWNKRETQTATGKV